MIAASMAKERASWARDIEKDILKASTAGRYYTLTDLFYPDDMIEKYIIPFLVEYEYTCRIDNNSMMMIEGKMCSRIYISWETPIKEKATKKADVINE